MGIRGKLNWGVGVVLLLSALVFGSIYSALERSTLLHEKHDHLLHVAVLMRLSLEGVEDEDALRTRVEELSERLSAATGAQHRMRIEDSRGRVLVTSHPEHPGIERTRSATAWEEWLPPSMTAVTPIEWASSSTAGYAQLVVEESLPGLPSQLRASLVRHLGFAVLLFGIAVTLTTGLAHRLVVRPVRELARATEKLGREGSWEPYEPTVRRNDEIGVLTDHVAGLSRRLGDAVRAERYGSAHLVAVGVQRSLEDPVRHARMELAALEALEALQPVSQEVAQLTARVSEHLDEIAEIGHRLKQIDRPGPT